MDQIKKVPSEALAGEEGTLEQLAERYKRARLLGDKIAHCLPRDNSKLYEAVSSCWSWFELRHYPPHLGLKPQNKVLRGIHCGRYKLCPVCAIRRSIKVYHSIKSTVEAIGFAPSDLYLHTLTMRNFERLDEGLAAIRDFYKSLRQGANNFKKRKGAELSLHPWAAVDGWIGHVEITRTSQGWHPHIHFLLAPKMDCKQLFAFKKIPHGLDDKGGFWGSEFTAMIGRKLHQFNGSFVVHTEQLASLEGGICEVAKYLFKFGELEPADVVHAYFATHRMRLSFSGGCFYGVDLEPDSLLDSEGVEGSRPFLDYLMTWSGAHYAKSIIGGMGEVA